MHITQYTWGQESSIQRVDIRKLESGVLEAYLHAPASAAEGALADVPASLARRGFAPVADEIDGQSVLRVSGFKNDKALFEALVESGFVRGEPEKQDIGPKDKKPFTDRLQKQTVKLSGVFGIIGHAAMAAAGVLEKDYKRVATALFYTTSTSTSAIYGAGQDDATSKIIKDMKDYLASQGVEIPEGGKLTAEELAKKGGVIETLHNFIKTHPLEVGNTVGLMGNIMLTYSGLKNGDGVSVGRMAGGLASMLGALTIILVPEKARQGATNYAWPGMEHVDGIAAENPTPQDIAAGEQNRSIPRKFTDWVQERPLRFVGMLNVGGNLALFQDAHKIGKSHSQKLKGYEDALTRIDTMVKTDGESADLEKMRESVLQEQSQALRASKSTMFAYTTAACYLVATTFTGMSSKAKIADYEERELMGKLCAMSANLIAAQPQDMRDEAIDKMAFYLSKQPDVKESKEELVAVINQKVEQIAQSPWMAKMAVERMQASVTSGHSGIGA